MDERKVKIGLRIAGVFIAVAALIGAGVVAAQLPIPATEPGGEVSENVDSPVSFDSYFDGGIIVPENGLTASGEPFEIPQGIAPDDNPVAGAARTNGTNGTNATSAVFSYYQVSGATLRGRDSATGYQYDGVGCSHVTSGSSRILNTELPIPDGATIKYLRVYYRDLNAASGVEGYITRYDPGTATLDLVHAGSTNAFVGGYGFVVSQEITETVNNTRYVYTLIGWPDEANVNNQICGLRVAYYLPQNNIVSLPVVRAR